MKKVKYLNTELGIKTAYDRLYGTKEINFFSLAQFPKENKKLIAAMKDVLDGKRTPIKPGEFEPGIIKQVEFD